MRENNINIGKMKTLLVAILMIASVIAVFEMTEPVKSGMTDTGWITGAITDIHPDGDEHGARVSGDVYIYWNSTVEGNSGVGTPVTYNVTFTRQENGTWTSGHLARGPLGNWSAERGNATYYIWNTTSGENTIPDGEWWVNVTATVANAGENHWINGTARRLNVSNTLPGTPGIDQFQGGSYNCTGPTYGNNVLSVNKVNYEVGQTYNINLNTSANWDDATYRIYKPIYNGTDSESDDSWYSLDWYKTGITIDGASPVDTSITFDTAGLWLIDSGDHWADANFKNVTWYNRTVHAWFWVNTSTTYEMNEVTALPTEFQYNSSGYLTLQVTDAGSEVTDHAYKKPIVDIRRDDNGTSIFQKNRETGLTNWEYTGFIKNNSYNGDRYGDAFPGQYGFWEVGNYSVYSYYDTDRLKDSIVPGASSADNMDGVQYYSESNYGCGASDNYGKRHYNDTYGASAAGNSSDEFLRTALNYTYQLGGPWDPPEYNTSLKYIRVTTGNPYAVFGGNGSTVYYGFDGELNITLRETSAGPAFDPSKINVTILDDDDVNVTQYFSEYISTDGSNEGTRRTGEGGATYEGRGGRIIYKKIGGKVGYILINMTKWGRNFSSIDNQAFADNGTWEVIIRSDMGTDRRLHGDGLNKQWAEEWNTTTSLSFRVKSGPTAQWKWVDDDGNVSADNVDEVIPDIPTPANLPVTVQFYLYDSGGNTFGNVEGDGTLSSGKCRWIRECAENITITGNSLFTGALSSFPGYADSLYSGTTTTNGFWTVPIIPTMSIGGGSITIRATLYNTSVSKTITIGTADYHLNGSVVTVTPNEFDIDTNQTISIEVLFADSGDPMQTVTATLYYLEDETSSITGPRPLDNHAIVWTNTYSGGAYSILFNTTMQTTNQTTAGLMENGDGTIVNTNGAVKAPRNLTVYVDGAGNRDGYALIQMKPVSDLEVHMTRETFMAGQEYDGVTLSCDFVNGTEGKSDTDTPSTVLAEKNKFHMKIYDKDHNDVTGTSTATSQTLKGIYDTKLTGTDAYSFSFNDVYGLEAGTYTIYAYNHTHNSEGQNATFEIKPVDITCDKAPFIWMSDTNISAIFTMTYDGSPVNGSLTIDNMSDVGSYNKTWVNGNWDGTGSPGANSLEIDDTFITNGVYTVDDVTADALTEGRAYLNLTLWFKPTIDGHWARAKDRILVEVPSVTPDPEYIPLGRTTKVYCTATGRGETLPEVFIGLVGQGFNGSSTTDVDGRVAFSITPATTGNISINVGQWNRTLEDTVIQVVAWVIDASTDADVNEGEQFTVTVIKEGTTDAVVGATITIVGIGTDTTDANGQATFTAPEVTSDRTYTIKVTKEGYAPDPDGLSITVINIPKLILVIPDKVQATTTFEVAVADDTGGAIVGAIITFNEKTYTTGVNGIAKLTAPKTKGDYSIKATFGNYEPATDTVTVTAAPGIPGFELLSLIAALGVAFILFRRRRRR